MPSAKIKAVKISTSNIRPGTARPGTVRPAPLTPRPGCKREAAIALLRRQQGATMAELTEATGWLPHSTRAVISGLRKAGLAITRSKRGTETCYQIAEQA